MKTFLLTAMISTTLLLGAVSFAPKPAYAAVDPACNNSKGFLLLPTWYEYLDVAPGDGGRCQVKVGSGAAGAKIDDGKVVVTKILLAVFDIMLRLAGLAAVVFVIWGGIKYQLSQGAPEEVQKARSIILNAVIGLAITMSAVVIVNLVGSQLS